MNVSKNNRGMVLFVRFVRLLAVQARKIGRMTSTTELVLHPTLRFCNSSEVTIWKDIPISNCSTVMAYGFRYKNGHILLTGQWYAPSAVYSVILLYTLLYSVLLRYTPLYSIILRYTLVWSGHHMTP